MRRRFCTFKSPLLDEVRGEVAERPGEFLKCHAYFPAWDPFENLLYVSGSVGIAYPDP